MFPQVFFPPSFFPYQYFAAHSQPEPPSVHVAFRFSNVQAKKVLDVFVPALWSTLTMRLFVNKVLALPSTEASQLQEATYSGYGPETLSMSVSAGPTPQFVWSAAQSGFCTFNPPNVAPFKTPIYGFYVTDPDGDLVSVQNVRTWPYPLILGSAEYPILYAAFVLGLGSAW